MLKQPHVRLCRSHRDGHEKHLRSPCLTRLAAPHANDNPADNSRLPFPQLSPLAPTLRCLEHLTDSQAGLRRMLRLLPPNRSSPASSAGAASTAAAFGQFRRPEGLGYRPCSGSYRALVPRYRTSPQAQGPCLPDNTQQPRRKACGKQDQAMDQGDRYACRTRKTQFRLRPSAQLCRPTGTARAVR